ncbi:MAG: alpha/beta fold hydrolase [Cytophagales bacterium]
MAFVYHRQRGQGSTLVLIHGFCETHQVWDDLVSILSADFNVLTPDLPGFGQSELPTGDFTIDQVADCLLLWLQSITVSPVVVIGHSLGGYIAMAMASKNPDSFAGVGLFHSTASADSEEKKQNRNKTIEFVKRKGMKAFADVFVPGLFYQKNNPKIERVHQLALSTRMETMIGYSLAMRDRPSREPWLRSFRNNFLIVAGVQDSVIPLNLLKYQSNLAAKSTYCELPNVGHMGMFEAPEKAVEAIRSFTFVSFTSFAN